MAKKPLYKLHRQAATAQLKEVRKITRKIQFAVAGALIEGSIEQVFYNFMFVQMAEIVKQTEQIQIRIDNLTTLADPNLPEDLPF